MQIASEIDGMDQQLHDFLDVHSTPTNLQLQSLDEDAFLIYSYFISVTDHLPSDIRRSLSLIKSLSEKYAESSVLLSNFLCSLDNGDTSEVERIKKRISRIDTSKLRQYQQESYNESIRLFELVKSYRVNIEVEIKRINKAKKLRCQVGSLSGSQKIGQLDNREAHKIVTHRQNILDARNSERRSVLSPAKISESSVLTRVLRERKSSAPLEISKRVRDQSSSSVKQEILQTSRRKRKTINEPTYCVCHDISYGDMIACDDKNCKIEWYHLGCVNLQKPPKGQWICSECRKRGRK
ncbi:hypothetical protein V1511DRAFT_512888 [Dipodascopsis uninucleata]